MAKAFKKEPIQSRSVPAETPYLRAKQEWDSRIGSVQVQAKNWRFLALISSLIALLLLIVLVIVIAVKKNIIYVAEVTKAGHVVNVAPLHVKYRPTGVQESYFVANFVKLVRSLPLDPVVAKQNLMTAYSFLTKRSSEQLNKYLQKNNPLQWLGKKTITIKITDVSPLTGHTYQVGWTETTIDANGLEEGVQAFNGVFTILIKTPTSEQNILSNPLGIYIIDFNITPRENGHEK